MSKMTINAGVATMRKSTLLKGLIGGICLGALVMPATAFAQFGGYPTVTPKEVDTLNKLEKKKIEEEKKKPSYLVVDKRSNGGVNSYVSIQAAVDAVAEGGTVVIMPGEYNENVTLRKAVNLQGDRGPGNRVRIAPLDSSKPCLSYTPKKDSDHALIQNIEFTTVEMSAGTVNGSSNQDIFRQKVSNTGSFGNQPCVLVNGGVFTMKESTVSGLVDQFNADYSGSSVYEYATNDIAESYYSRSYLDTKQYYDGSMVKIAGGTAFLEKNIIRGGMEGIRASQQHSLWERTVLVDNVITENNFRGVYLTSASSVQATGNLIEDNGIGIDYNGEGEATIVGNKILNNNSDGVYLGQQAKQVMLSLNEIASNYGNGVKVIRANGFIRDDNVFQNNGWGGEGLYDVNTMDAGYNNLPKIGNTIAVNAKIAYDEIDAKYEKPVRNNGWFGRRKD